MCAITTAMVSTHACNNSCGRAQSTKRHALACLRLQGFRAKRTATECVEASSLRRKETQEPLTTGNEREIARQRQETETHRQRYVEREVDTSKDKGQSMATKTSHMQRMPEH